MHILMLGSRDEWISGLEAELREAYPKSSIVSFRDPLLAIQYAAAYPVDLAISERRLKVMDGAAFLGKLRERFPDVVPVLVLEEGERPAAFPGCICVSAPVDVKKLQEKVNIL